jgi:hypothetical protein
VRSARSAAILVLAEEYERSVNETERIDKEMHGLNEGDDLYRLLGIGRLALAKQRGAIDAAVSTLAATSAAVAVVQIRMALGELFARDGRGPRAALLMQAKNHLVSALVAIEGLHGIDREAYGGTWFANCNATAMVKKPLDQADPQSAVRYQDADAEIVRTAIKKTPRLGLPRAAKRRKVSIG